MNAATTKSRYLKPRLVITVDYSSCLLFLSMSGGVFQFAFETARCSPVTVFDPQDLRFSAGVTDREKQLYLRWAEHLMDPDTLAFRAVEAETSEANVGTERIELTEELREQHRVLTLHAYMVKTQRGGALDEYRLWWFRVLWGLVMRGEIRVDTQRSGEFLARDPAAPQNEYVLDYVYSQLVSKHADTCRPEAERCSCEVPIEAHAKLFIDWSECRLKMQRYRNMKANKDDELPSAERNPLLIAWPRRVFKRAKRGATRFIDALRAVIELQRTKDDEFINSLMATDEQEKDPFTAKRVTAAASTTTEDEPILLPLPLPMSSVIPSLPASPLAGAIGSWASSSSLVGEL